MASNICRHQRCQPHHGRHYPWTLSLHRLFMALPCSMIAATTATTSRRVRGRRRHQGQSCWTTNSVPWSCFLLLTLTALLRVVHAAENSTTKASLVFQAQCQLVSEPFCNDPQILREFLEQPHVRNLLLSAGGQRTCQVLPISVKDESSRIVGLWRQACERYYGMEALPDVLSVRPFGNTGRTTTNDDGAADIVAIATETEVKFPGFKTINTVLNGCRHFPHRPLVTSLKGPHSATTRNAKRGFLPSFVAGGGESLVGEHKETHNNNDDVVYKFYLIGDKKRWEGPAPIVWLVKKLTGEHDEAHETGPTSLSYHPSETRAVSKVSIYVQEPLEDSTKEEDAADGDANKSDAMSVGVRLDIDCTVRVEFPKLLLKLLPAPQSKVEEKGTNSVRKAILNDATLAVEAIRQTWIKEQEEKRELQQRLPPPDASPSRQGAGFASRLFRRPSSATSP